MRAIFIGRSSDGTHLSLVRRRAGTPQHRLLILGAAALSAALWAYACGDGTTEPTPPPPDPPRATSLTVTPATARLTALGATVQLTAEVRDQNGNVMAGAAMSWASSAAAVATVSNSGLVTAAGNGTATITATAGAASGTASGTVAQEVSSVTVTPAADTLVEGDTLRLAAEAADANGHAVPGEEFAWASSDTSVVRVDGSGLITGVGAGMAEVTATSAGSGVMGRAALAVVAPMPTAIEVTPDTVALTALGQTAQLAAEVRDQVGRTMEGIPVSWSSADTTVATVHSAGLVTAIGGGATTVTATADEASGEAFVTVMQSAGSVVVSPTANIIAPGDTLRLAAEAFDENGHRVEGAEFGWASSDVSVATVDASGLVTGVAEGTATVTAAAGDASGASEITVENPDRAALVALYNATDGPNWVNNENWLTDSPLGEWYGVDTDDSGRVVSLDLSGHWDREAEEYVRHGLSGPIPPELGNLANLTVLWLNVNDLTGPIPPELDNLANLTELSLRANELEGPIPPELGSLANLRSLYLDYNDLTGPIPPELGNLANLTVLWLNVNDLTGPIPPELDNLANLTELWLSNNRLTGAIPPELGNLANLTELLLGANHLTGPIPPELGNLANLRWLYLGNANLTGQIPPELGNLANLTVLTLDSNDLTGQIPPELGNLANLGWLFLDSNDLTGQIPPELGNLANLTVLTLYSNDLTGQIPPELGNLANLTWLPLSDNKLTGPIPPELDNLANLRSLTLSDNNLSGPIPPELGNLSNLSSLRISGNRDLAGPIPSEYQALRLDRFYWNDTGLCSPDNSSFQAWLDAIEEHRGGPVCQDGGEFEAFSGLRINNDGSVTLKVGSITLSAGKAGCFSGGGTLNGKVYDYHWTAWQRDTGSGWNEVSGSRQTGKLCGYDLTSAPSGKYRLVGDMTLAGTRAKYKSENEVSR